MSKSVKCYLCKQTMPFGGHIYEDINEERYYMIHDFCYQRDPVSILALTSKTSSMPDVDCEMCKQAVPYQNVFFYKECYRLCENCYINCLDETEN